MSKKFVFNDKSIKALPLAEGTQRYEVWDEILPGFGLRISARSKSFFVLIRPKGSGKPVRRSFGRYPHIGLSDARREARTFLEKTESGTYLTEAEETKDMAFSKIAEEFVTRYLDTRTRGKEGARIVRRYLIPYFKDIPINQISRKDIAKMMDDLSDRKFQPEPGKTVGGPVMADRALGRLTKLMNWYQTRDDEFTSPIIQGMRVTSDKDRERERILSDDEIRAFWKTAQRESKWHNGPQVFGGLLMMCLLTAQRRDAVAGMCRSEINEDGVWHVPATRDKNAKERYLPLSKTALGIVHSTNSAGQCDLVFTTNGQVSFSGFSRSKNYFDKAMIDEMLAAAARRCDRKAAAEASDLRDLFAATETGTESAMALAKQEFRAKWWRIHDLRRTAKTLMVRAGVRPDISERALSHAIGGVEGIYDRWDYLPELREAFDKLEAQILEIVQE